jgi:ATP-dependent DNA helicase RecG
MTEIMEKTGLVERSGQGIDKIYSITLAEGKSEPNYKDSTIFQVVLKLNGAVQDQAFSLFIQDVQNSRTDADKLGVLEIMALYQIKEGQFALIKPELLKKLEMQQLITRPTNSTRYSLAGAYASLTSGNRIGNRYLAAELELLLPIFRPEGLKIGDLETALSASLNRNQIKFLLSKLQEDEIILAEGKGKGTRYKVAASFDTSDTTTLTGRVVSKLRELYPIEENEPIG